MSWERSINICFVGIYSDIVYTILIYRHSGYMQKKYQIRCPHPLKALLRQGRKKIQKLLPMHQTFLKMRRRLLSRIRAECMILETQTKVLSDFKSIQRMDIPKLAPCMSLITMYPNCSLQSICSPPSIIRSDTGRWGISIRCF